MTNELTMTWTLLNPTARFRTFQIHLDSEELLRIIKETLLQIAAKHQVELQIRDQEFVLQNEAGPIAVTTVQPPPDRSCSVFGVAPPPMSRADVLVRRGQVIGSPTVRQVLVELENFFDGVENILSDGEAEFVLRSMPLLELIAPADSPDPVLSQFALIWRDHFLEENIALLRAFERAGIPPSWIYVLSKGDQTAKCDRIAAYFRRRGYHTDLFDSNYPDPIIEQSETQRIRGTLETFVAEARKNGRNIMAIDDGGLLFNCFRDNQRIMDFAVEVTIVGTKRLKRLPSIDIPIYDVGRSRLKAVITYPEIAESGVMRVREMIRSEKLRGRPVLVLGYGTSGRQVSRVLHGLGCRVSVVDTDMLSLVEAAEAGFRTYLTASEAIVKTQPFLVFGCTGEIALTVSDFDALPDGAFVTAIATKDLSELRRKDLPFRVTPLPEFGYEYQTENGKQFTQLGDGRSFNLFRSEAIPNRANDVFKAGTFVAAKALARKHKELRGGIYVTEVDEAIKQSGLLEMYYHMYLKE